MINFKTFILFTKLFLSFLMITVLIGCGETEQKTETLPFEKSSESHLSPIVVSANSATIAIASPVGLFTDQGSVSIENPVGGDYYVEVIYDSSVVMPTATVGIRIDGTEQVNIKIIYGQEATYESAPYVFHISINVADIYCSGMSPKEIYYSLNHNKE